MISRRRWFFFGLGISCTSLAWSAPLPWSVELNQVRQHLSLLEKQWLENKNISKSSLKRLKILESWQKHQHQHQSLIQQRLQQLQKNLLSLEDQKQQLKTQRKEYQRKMQHFLKLLNPKASVQVPESLSAPRKRLLVHLIQHGLRKLETMQADLQDAQILENQIRVERQKWVQVSQDLKEQESFSALSRQFKHHRFSKYQAQYEKYLKKNSFAQQAEVQLQQNIQSWQEHWRWQSALSTLRPTSLMQRKGRLPLPVPGARVMSFFGKRFDPQLGFSVFKKGIDLKVIPSQPVRAIFDGRIVYAGSLPHYGKMILIDHGHQFYSLCAHLGRLAKEVSDVVLAGEVIGHTHPKQNIPLYFEIRDRNVAVDPLQWVKN